SDQLGHAQVSMTQDRYLSRRLTDRQTAMCLKGSSTVKRPHLRKVSESVPPGSGSVSEEALTWEREPAPGFEPGTARLQVGCAASCAMPAGAVRPEAGRPRQGSAAPAADIPIDCSDDANTPEAQRHDS